MAEQEYDLTGAMVAVALPALWEVTLASTSVTLRARAAPLVPSPLVTFAVVPGADADEALREQVAQAALVLTDFTVLHLEPHEAEPSGWRDGAAPALPVVTAAFRQGVFTMIQEITVVAGDDSRFVVATAVCPLDEWPGQEDVLVTAVRSARVTWAR